MRVFATMLCAVSWSVSAAWAQALPANPVLDHFRAYNSAIERGDLATADTEAAALAARAIAAWDASGLAFRRRVLRT